MNPATGLSDGNTLHPVDPGLELEVAVGALALTTGTLVGTETLTLSGTGTVADKNVGTAKALTLGSLALGNGSNGGLASNYTFTGGTLKSRLTCLGRAGRRRIGVQPWTPARAR